MGFDFIEFRDRLKRGDLTTAEILSDVEFLVNALERYESGESRELVEIDPGAVAFPPHLPPFKIEFPKIEEEERQVIEFLKYVAGLEDIKAKYTKALEQIARYKEPIKGEWPEVLRDEDDDLWVRLEAFNAAKEVAEKHLSTLVTLRQQLDALSKTLLVKAGK